MHASAIHCHCSGLAHCGIGVDCFRVGLGLVRSGLGGLTVGQGK